MKILWSWLHDHGQWDVTPQEAAQALTFSGTETEIVPAYPWADYVHVACVQSVAEHPDAARLRVCQVDVGQGRVVTIVCGAANVRAGMHTMVALPGCMLPGQNRPLEASALRGVVSHGMLCSAKELAMEDAWGETDGLVELDEATTVVGQSLRDFLPASDALLVLNVTPNRGDLLSHRGVARELMALGLGTCHPYTVTPEWPMPQQPSLQPLPFQQSSSHQPSLSPPDSHQLLLSLDTKASLIKVDTSACSLFMLGQLDDVQATLATPGLVRRRLAATNSSWHHVCVDWTNYVAQDVGQPLHVYDVEQICGPVTVRLSRQGETFLSLQGTTYTLPDNVIVVADDAGILSIAGIMGGMRARCTQQSQRVFLEAACFDASSIARTGQALGLHSASRSRFERGIDAAGVAVAFSYSMAWLCRHTSARATSWDQHGTHPGAHKPILFAPQDIARRCGVHLPHAVVEKRLKALGASVSIPSSLQDSWAQASSGQCASGNSPSAHDVSAQGEEIWQVTPPSWRHDWTQSWDCVNEVLRGQGYEDVPATPWHAPALRPHEQRHTNTCLPALDYRWLHKARQWWIAQGVYEAVTWSFVSQQRALPWVNREEDVQDLHLSNPLSDDMAVLRPRVMASLYDIIEHHRRHRVICGPVFEIGPCFKGLQPQDQHEHLSLMWPKERTEAWSPQTNTIARSWSLYDIKDMVARFVAAMGYPGCTWESAQETGFHPGQCATIWYTCPQAGRVRLGVVGAAHPQWGHDVLMADFPLNQWPNPVLHGFYPIPSLHAMRIDVSCFVPQHTHTGTVLQAMKQEVESLSHIDVIDWYRAPYGGSQDATHQASQQNSHRQQSLHTSPHTVPDHSQGEGMPEHQASNHEACRAHDALAAQSMMTSVTIACYFQPIDRAFTASDTQLLLHRVVACAQRHNWVLRGTLGDVSSDSSP